MATRSVPAPTTPSTPSGSPPPPGFRAGAAFGEKIGKYRWTICALLFFATTINYIDR